MKLTKFAASSAAILGLAAMASAGPAVAQQADFTKIVQIGDSITAGYLDFCLVRYGQDDSYGSILARQTKTGPFEQPRVDVPGQSINGGCKKLHSLSPLVFDTKSITGKPLNATLSRPYDNLGIPGFNVAQVSTSKTQADNGNPLTDLVLRGGLYGGGPTMLDQAASLKPTFLTIWIGNNDILGAATAGTVTVVIPGLPAPVEAPGMLTKKEAFDASFKKITDAMKVAQGGTGKGVVMTIPDVTALPFFTTVSLAIPGAGGLNFYGSRGTFAPIPAGSLLTLAAASFAGVGYGIPCAVLDQGQVPATDPKRLNCNKPLPDTGDSTTVPPTPGVILYPDEVKLLKDRTAELNASIKANAEAAGYKVFDTNALFNDIVNKVRILNYGGMPVTQDYLTGGLLSYDGVHPTALGYAIVADELIQFINKTYGNTVPRVSMYPYLFSGNSQPGGFPPTIGFPLSDEEAMKYAAQIFNSDSWSSLQVFSGMEHRRALPDEEGAATETPVRGDRDFSDRIQINQN